jgi:hypothetical protein
MKVGNIFYIDRGGGAIVSSVRCSHFKYQAGLWTVHFGL